MAAPSAPQTTFVYDADGNMTRDDRFLYSYDAFGNIIGQSGTMADTFSFRFSTKYFDADCDLYYYGYRFYAPEWRIWLTISMQGRASPMRKPSPARILR